MAGPGGGPPRKTHRKSRKGCATCKKRHIKCDENFPQWYLSLLLCLTGSGKLTPRRSRKCTKHNCRCDYRDNPPPSNEPQALQGPNLLWTPSIQGAIENWHRTGTFPFPNFGLRSIRQFQGLSPVELRLVYHLLSVHQDMQRLNLAQCTLWVQELPR